MPITNNASYIPTMNEFIAHWSDVDTVVGALILNINDATMDRPTFTALRATVSAANATVIDKLNDQEIARGDIDLKKQQLQTWLSEFNALLDGYYQGTPYIHARPKVPGISEGQERFLAPMVDVVSLWGKVNAAAPRPGLSLPLTLADGTTRALAQTALEALQEAYAAERVTAQAVALARADRDIQKRTAYEAMKAYRVVVPAYCAEHPSLIETLPQLTPGGGHTPSPVNASAVFQAPDNSKVVYDASTDPDLAHYELRGNPGTTYNDDDAVVVATNSPGEPREFLSNFGLTQPGAKVALKVYVILSMGNEAGSAAMVVERPV